MVCCDSNLSIWLTTVQVSPGAWCPHSSRPCRVLGVIPNPIRRTLAHQDDQLEWGTVGEDEIPGFPQPVVILGDPGLGKSVLTETLGELPNMKRFRAGPFLRNPRLEGQIVDGDRIVVDGLDEIASAYPGGGVHAVLSKLAELGYPPFILSCREADWRGAADRVQIEDDYGAAPVLLHLQPFDWDDAQAFLTNEFPALDAGEILEHLANRGLDRIYENPLTLKLLGEVAQQLGPLPDSRAQLLERACAVMLTEENPRHQGAPHVRRTDDELLLGAGAICATQILCDRSGIFAGPYAMTPEGAVHLRDVAVLPFGNAAEDSLRTRLFQAETERFFLPIHRVVAEYLGARWLARGAAEGRSERRIFGLFRPGDGIPTSLRGLHAWIGHFHASLAYRCIEADPYGVLRYGDAETIGLAQARALLDALKALSEADPYFASEDWSRHPASGLMRREFKDEILSLIISPDSSLQLSILLLNAMVGTDLARELVPELNELVFCPDRTYHERACAADVLRASGVVDDWDAFLHRLLERGDLDSAHLACELLDEIGARTVPLNTGVDIVFSYLRISVSDVPRTDGNLVRDISGRLFFDLDTDALIRLLDTVASRVEPLFEEANHSSLAELGDLARRLIVRVLEAGAAIMAERLWAWIRWQDRDRGYDEDARRRLEDLLGHGKPLRIQLLEHVLLTPCAATTWMAAHRLQDLGLGLFPTHDDVAGLLRAARDRAGDGPINETTWTDLLLLGGTHKGLAEPVRRAAIEAARDDPAMLASIAIRSDVGDPEWKREQQARQARQEAERQEVFQSHRDGLGERLGDVAAGDFRILAQSAEAYVGRWHRWLKRDAPPEARLHELLGPDLGGRVLEGFIAVLGRKDLPSASEIVEIRFERMCHKAELPMICGVAEMLRQGRDLAAVPRATLAAVYMAWWRLPEYRDNAAIDIASALEAVLFPSEREVEDHFRASIEPQLAVIVDHVEELDRLTYDDRWASLGGRLSVDWLRFFPDLPCSVQKNLLSPAIERCPEELRRQIDIGERIQNAPDRELKQLWLAAAFVLDFDHHRDVLVQAASDDSDLIWPVRDRFGRNYEEVFADFSIPQLVFIVEAFGVGWQNIARPPGPMWGSRDPWDASRFIAQTISAIASRPSPEATAALQQLIDGPAESYVDVSRHALAQQRKARRDAEYAAPRVGELQSVMDGGIAASIDGMRAYFMDRLDTLQERIQASNTNMREAYWGGNGPKGENYCRDRLVEHLSGLMPPAIQIEPEARMPEEKRVDFVLSHNENRLPIEIKGEWHDKVWDAASEQLDAYYAVEWRAQGRGIYVVLWFGNFDGKLRAHPEGHARPRTPE